MDARYTLVGAALLAMSAMASAQSVISAKSGLIHYVEGQVTLDGKPIEVKYSQFPEVRENQVLKTEDGRAEVLLNPGVFLRLAENSSFRMVSNRLSDTRVEALSGSMMIEHGEMAKDNAVSLLYKDKSITFLKSGLYRLDADQDTFRVYQGEAKVTGPGQSVVAKQAREVQLGAPALTAMKFDNKDGDEFYRWASRRAGYLALANVSAAKSFHDSGYSMTSGMWGWNPWFGMFTYIPYGGMYMSPFGYSFWTPSLVSRFYYPGWYGGYYNNGYYGGGGGGAASSRTGRYDAASSYSIPSRPASTFNNGGGMMSGGSIHSGGGGGFSGGSGGGMHGGGGASAGGGGGASAGGGGAAASGGGGPSGRGR